MVTHPGTYSDSELTRLQALYRYEILDTPPQESFDRITSLARQLFHLPVAAICLVDYHRIWFKSKQGLEITELDRNCGLCPTVSSDRPEDNLCYIPDTLQNPLTKSNSLIVKQLQWRFYAEALLYNQDGLRLGSLLIADYEPRTLSEQEQKSLGELAALVMELLEARLTALKLAEVENKGVPKIEPEEVRLALARQLVETRRLNQLYEAERQARAEADEAQRRVSTILESITDAFLTLNQQWQVTYLNPKAQQLLQVDRPALLNHNFWHCFPELAEGRLYQKYHQALSEQISLEFEEFFTPNNSWLEFHIYPSPEGLSIYFQDITERKQTEEALRQSKEALLHSQKMEAIGRLAGGVAHDFNNLLTGILGYAELVLLSLHADNPLREDVEEIKKEAERAATLTRQLLAFSRRQLLQLKVLNLNGVVENMDRLLRRLIGEDIELKISLDPQLHQIKADPGQLEQVIMNLAVNARDAMPEGGKLLVETTNVELTPIQAKEYTEGNAGKYVMLAFADTGMGMDKTTRARIFEPFFTTKDQGKGTGLGLAMVYGIVKQSGGYIWVDSETGKGTSFKIYLPCPEVEEVEEDLVAEVASVLPASARLETILVVEDERLVRQLTCRVLKRDGYQVLEAQDAREAMKLFKEYGGIINLVLTDVIMPGMSGPELIEQLKILKPELNVLYMSGYTDRAFSQQELSSGATLLEKPFVPATLLAKVKEKLEAEASL